MHLSGNYNFEHPDEDQPIDLQKLWGYQQNLPRISITWKVIEEALPLLWAERKDDLGVDFTYNEFDKFLPVYDRNIEFC